MEPMARKPTTRREAPPVSERDAAAGDLTAGDIYASIYAAILDSRLKPGTKLVEERLAEIFAVSRPRIREVIARLAHEQIVELFPQRGAFVARPSPEKAAHVLDARRVIEPAIIRRLIERLSPAKLERLREHQLLEQDARARQDKQSIIRLGGEFHTVLGELAGNAELARIIRELSTLTNLVIFLYDVPTASSCRHDEHAGLIDAIAARDTAAAERLVLEHLDHIEQSLRFESEEQEVDLAEVFRQ
jgi:DNA-binding GntR family transcriptional regulator